MHSGVFVSTVVLHGPGNGANTCWRCRLFSFHRRLWENELWQDAFKEHTSCGCRLSIHVVVITTCNVSFHQHACMRPSSQITWRQEGSVVLFFGVGQVMVIITAWCGGGDLIGYGWVYKKKTCKKTHTNTQTVSLLAPKPTSTPPNKSGIMSCKSASISRSRVGVVAAARSSATQPLHHFPLFLLQYHTFFPRPTFRNDLQYSLGISIGRKVEIWLKWTVWTWRVQDDTWTQQHHSCCPTKSTRCRPALSSLAKSCYGLWKPHI